MGSNDDLSKYILYAIIIYCLLFFISCKESNGGLKKFPTKYIYEVSNEEPGCIQYEIIVNDPLTVSEGKMLLPKECPFGLFGFDIENTADIFTWIRDAQKLAKEKCK